jgi:hypothetical protein
MVRVLIVVVAVLAAIALPTVASAQVAHPETGRKAEFRLSSAVLIGDKTVQPGDYRFECKNIDGQHMLVVTSVDGDQEVARVPCNAVELARKAALSQLLTTKKNGIDVLTEVDIKGETIGHRLAS